MLLLLFWVLIFAPVQSSWRINAHTFSFFDFPQDPLKFLDQAVEPAWDYKYYYVMWFKFPLITVKPGQALAQRVHQWIDYLKIEFVSRCMCNEQWISDYYFQYLSRIFTAHYACRNIYRDGSEIYDNKQFQLSNNNLKIYWNLRRGGTRTSCYYGQHHNKGKQQWLNTWWNIQTIHWKDSTPQWT